jgi:hypothetical protein
MMDGKADMLYRDDHFKLVNRDPLIPRPHSTSPIPAQFLIMLVTAGQGIRLPIIAN